METLKNLKDTYAQEQGYEDWGLFAYDVENEIEMEDHMDEICIRAQKAALEKAAENAKIEMDLQLDWYFVSKESITNPENLIR